MTVQIRLHSVTKQRQHDRDVERQAVATARNQLEKIEKERNLITEARSAAVRELDRLCEADFWNVEKVLIQRNYLEELGQLLVESDRNLSESTSRLSDAVQRLIIADRDARVFGQFAHRQLAELERQRTKRELQEFEDAINFFGARLADGP